MTEPVDIPLNLDPSGYVAGAQQASGATQSLSRELGTLSASSIGVRRAMDAITPSREFRAAWEGSGAAAASFQASTAGLAASARVTHQSLRDLTGGVRDLARQFPIGTQSAIATVQAVQGLGLSARSQVPQIAALSRQMTMLSGATGELGPALATSFGQLNRQMASLDPTRVGKFADVLTTMTLKSGASASGILEFSRAISPMAQAAGMGESAVLGISTAFSKLGDDGYAAANAVNKILTDLNRSVRDGSNDMSAYAQIVGVTAQQFRAMYTANPARTLASVTDAIGRSGVYGQRELEQLGLEGTRTQRALLNVAQSGGLGQVISQAIGAYGNGSTARASAGAFSGLDAARTRLATTVGELADILGEPLLRPLTRWTNLVTKAVSVPIGPLSTPAAQHVMGVAGYGLVAGMIARRFLGVGTTAATLGMIGTSGPVRSFAAGRLDPLVPPGGLAPMMAGQQGWWMRRRAMFALPALEAEGMGRLDAGPMGGANAGAYAYGQRIGMARLQTRAFMENERISRLGSVYTTLGRPMPYTAAMTQLQADQAAAGPPIVRGIRGAVRYGSLAYEANMRLLAQPWRAVGTPFYDRAGVDPLVPAQGGAVRTLGAGLRASMGLGGPGAMIGGVGRSLRAFDRDLAQTSSGFRVLRSSMMAFRDVAGTTSMFGGMGLRAIGRGALSLVGGPVGATMVGGLAAYEGYSHFRAGVARGNAAIDKGIAPNEIANRYADTLGLASDATSQFTSTLVSASQQLTTSARTFRDAGRVDTAARIAAAGQNAGRPVVHYAGSAAQITAQVVQAYAGGITPGQAAAVRNDLINQGLPAAEITGIIASVSRQVGARSSQTARPPMRLQMSTLRTTAGAAAAASAAYHPSQLTSMGGWQDSLTNPMGIFGNHPGQGGQAIQVDTKTTAQVDQMASAIASQYKRDSTTDPDFAKQSLVNYVNRAMDIIAGFGDGNLFAYASKVFSRLLSNPDGAGQKGTSQQTSLEEYREGKKNYGSFTEQNAARGGQLAGQHYGALVKPPTKGGIGLSLSGRGGVMPQPLTDPMFLAAGQSGSRLAGAFDPNAAGGTPQATFGRAYRRAITAGPEAYEVQDHVVNRMIAAAQAMGMSLSQVAVQFSQLSARAPANSQQAQLFGAAQTQAQQMLAYQMGGMTRAGQYRTTVGTALNDLRGLQGVPGTVARDQRYADRSTILAAQSDMRDYYRQRLMVQYQYQIASSRSRDDYQRQVGREEEDFYISRTRAQADYARQVRRQSEDAAASMYSPYQRIATQPTWDAANLYGNRAEQLTAMRQQIRNINKLRELGLDETVIDQLRLYDPANAQQAQQLVLDLSAHRGMVGRLNKQGNQFQSAARRLLSDDPTFRRQREDFNRQMRQTEADFNRQLDRQASDFRLSMARMAEDVHMQDLEITGGLGKLAGEMHQIVRGEFVDLSNQVEDTLAATYGQVEHWGPKIKNGLANATGGGGGGGGGGGTPPISGFSSAGIHLGGAHHGSRAQVGTKHVGNDTIPIYGPKGSYLPAEPSNKIFKDIEAMGRYSGLNPIISATTNGSHVPGSYHFDGQAVDFTFPNPMGKEAQHKMRMLDRFFGENYGHVLAELIHNPGPYNIKNGHEVNGSQFYSAVWQGHRNHVHVAATPQTLGYAQGGIATKPHLGLVAERGVSEAMIPLDGRGVKVIANAMRAYLSVDDARELGVGGRAGAISIHAEYHYDQRNDMRGSSFTVEANNPRELGEQLRETARAQNLVGSPRGVAWQRS